MTAVQIALYANHELAAHSGQTDWDGNASLTLTLHTNAYTPNRLTHDAVADLTNEVATGSGYTSGGVPLTGATATLVVANSWSPTWVAATAYKVGQIVRPTTGNLFVYRVSVAGTSHATTEPTWPTVIGATVTDNGVTWTCVGRAVIKLDAADLTPAWSAFSATFRHVVLSDRAPVGAANQKLVGVYTFGSDQTGGGGDFDITFDTAGVVAIPVP